MPKLEFQRRQISILEFPIKHFFEGTKNKIEFIHKSIYEYFVSEYIFKTLWSKIVMRKGVKEIAGMLGEL